MLNLNSSNRTSGDCLSLKESSIFSLVLGKRATGKTFFVLNDIYPRISDEIEDIFVISEPVDEQYKKITNNIYSVNKLDQIIKSYDNLEKKYSKKLLIVDISDYRNLNKNNKFSNLVSIHTHINLNIILILQSSVGMDPITRNSINNLYMAYESSNGEIKRNYEYFGKSYPDFKSFSDSIEYIQGQEFLHMKYPDKPAQYMRAHKQIKLKYIQSDELEDSEDIPELNEVVSEINQLINQLVGIRNRLKVLKKNSV